MEESFFNYKMPKASIPTRELPFDLLTHGSFKLLEKVIIIKSSKVLP